jgi:diadenosine tetraphosphatase ApaH/serine/threonine PP2A family protein phosphatase
MKSDAAGASRIGIFSDLHGNKHALLSVIETLQAAGVGEMFCCGDIVGYGAFPNECCQILREYGIGAIVGNHDHAALGLADMEYFNEIAREAITWTIEQLTEENREYLRALPLRIERDDCLFVHSSPRSPHKWEYVLTIGDARVNFEYFTQTACFIGHSHQPFAVENVAGRLSCPVPEHVLVAEGARYLVNVGSVGQPRDRNPSACCVIYDRRDKVIEFKRAPYDVDAAREAIMRAGLPPELGERLKFGW